MSFYKFGDHFKWFIARVSDIKDPEYLGRVRIRVLHNQTGELGKIKKNKGVHNDDLLWAWPLSGIQSASLSWVKLVEKDVGLEEFDTPDWINAVGLSPTGIALGTYVFGFYLDGQEQNIPIIFGTYHKQSFIPEPPTDDPNIHSMLQLKPPQRDPEFYSDVAALARGDEGNGGQTLPKEPYTKANALTVTSEPESAYKTEYPYNLTYTTKSGHAIELDDTVGHERIHIWHKSGSYEEISNGSPVGSKKISGRRVKKTTDSDYEIILKDKNSLVKRDYNREIANTENTNIGLNNNVTIGNNSTTAIGNNSITTVGNDVDVTIGEDGTIIIGGHLRIEAQGGISIGAPGGVTITEGTLTVEESGVIGTGGATGQFTTPTGQTVDVQDGIIVNIN